MVLRPLCADVAVTAIHCIDRNLFDPLRSQCPQESVTVGTPVAKLCWTISVTDPCIDVIPAT